MINSLEFWYTYMYMYTVNLRMCHGALGRIVIHVLVYILKCACDLHYNPFTKELFFVSSVLQWQ